MLFFFGRKLSYSCETILTKSKFPTDQSGQLYLLVAKPILKFYAQLLTSFKRKTVDNTCI